MTRADSESQFLRTWAALGGLPARIRKEAGCLGCSVALIPLAIGIPMLGGMAIFLFDTRGIGLRKLRVENRSGLSGRVWSYGRDFGRVRGDGTFLMEDRVHLSGPFEAELRSTNGRQVLRRVILSVEEKRRAEDGETITVHFR